MSQSIKKLGFECLQRLFENPKFRANDEGAWIRVFSETHEFNINQLVNSMLRFQNGVNPNLLTVTLFWVWNVDMGVRIVSTRRKYQLADALAELCSQSDSSRLSHLIMTESVVEATESGTRVVSNTHHIYWLRPHQTGPLTPIANRICRT